MTDKEFYEKMRVVEQNLKIIEDYEEMFGQVKKVASLYNEESESDK